jgi:hypothetical protein
MIHIINITKLSYNSCVEVGLKVEQSAYLFLVLVIPEQMIWNAGPPNTAVKPRRGNST